MRFSANDDSAPALRNTFAYCRLSTVFLSSLEQILMYYPNTEPQIRIFPSGSIRKARLDHVLGIEMAGNHRDKCIKSHQLPTSLLQGHNLKK